MTKQDVITNYLDLWTSSLLIKSTAGRGNNGRLEAYGIKKLRELILELAVQGKLVAQDPKDEPATMLLERNERKMKLLAKGGKARQADSMANRRTLGKPIHPGWTPATLGNLAFIQMGNSPPGSSYNDEAKGVPLINGPVEFSEGPFGFTKNIKFTTAPTYMCDAGDILVCVRGATTGRTNIARSASCIGRGVALVRAWEAQAYVNLFMWHIGGKLLEAGKGTTFPSISYSDLAMLSLAVPPLDEQKRIVAKVEELMALCDQLEQQQSTSLETHQTLVATLLDTLTRAESPADFQQAWQRIATHFDTLFTTEHSIDQLKQTILQLAVMGKLVRQDPNDEPASKLLARLHRERDDWLLDNRSANSECNTMIRKLAKLSKPPKPFALPESWDCAHLIQLARILVDCHNKTAPYSETGIPIIRTTNIRNGQFLFEDMKYVTEETYLFWSKRCPPESGDIIFTREAPMGEAAIIPDGHRFCLGQRTMLIRSMHSFISAEYLLLALTEPHLLERASVHAIGSTVKHLRVGDVEELSIPVPPLPEQLRIVAKVKELHAACEHLRARIRHNQQIQLHIADAVVEQAVA